MLGDSRHDCHQVGLTRSVVADNEDAFVVCRRAELQLWEHKVAQQIGHPIGNDKRLDESACLDGAVGFPKLNDCFDRLKLNEVGVLHAISSPSDSASD